MGVTGLFCFRLAMLRLTGALVHHRVHTSAASTRHEHAIQVGTQERLFLVPGSKQAGEVASD